MNNQQQEYVEATFRALTDALLPDGMDGDQNVHEYVIAGLDQKISIQQQLHYRVVPLAYPTAIMLDAAATQLVNAQKIHAHPQSWFSGGRMFSRLSRTDRIQVLTALENLYVDLYLLPSPFQNNAGMIKYVTDALNRFSLFGYYSEWLAYGTTRLFPPNHRRLEYFPLNWQRVGYPGVSYGYRAFRGFLFTIDEVEGGR
ncbi:hypothetical protein [Oceanobacillus halophilus]|uniref:Gluconate 2-dehydrogenase subunit 3 family protein n=1 Tax=Oceanobacillus halophilus TaxID=930130 RepID=A0A494ZRW2_9BACI|nr:hypothetical protein [Oceanobacillus halophilus]RKQ27486.1 hypothetical protein D8M06_19560 [Oceanobacillus halophilus]